MSFEDCQDYSLRRECQLLLNSVTDFKLYTAQSLRLAVSGRLTTPLYLTLHRGACNHSCEGGALQPCDTEQEHFTWLNVSSPFVLENHTFIQPHFYYCITAKISEPNCCPVCTDTSFMEDVTKPVSNSVFGDSQWNAAIIVSLLILLLGTGMLLSCMYRKVKTSWRPTRSKCVDNVPLKGCTYDGIESIRRTVQPQVVCLYIKEESEPFMETINTLQSSLRKRGLHVIDIYEVEESISQPIIRWIQDALENPEMKMVLVDTSTLRLLWKRDVVNSVVCRATDRAILYMRDCVSSHSLYNKWFVVRFHEDSDCVSEYLNHLTNGRRYICPAQIDQLAKDIKRAQ